MKRYLGMLDTCLVPYCPKILRSWEEIRRGGTHIIPIVCHTLVCLGIGGDTPSKRVYRDMCHRTPVPMGHP